MQEVLKQKNKVKKPKTFGAVNNAYEIYHLVHKAITEDFMLSKDIVKSEQYAEYIFRTKSQLNTLAYNLIDKYFHMIYDNIVQINNRCYILTTK